MFKNMLQPSFEYANISILSYTGVYIIKPLTFLKQSKWTDEMPTGIKVSPVKKWHANG